MTDNLTITDTELQAIRSAERYLSTIAHEDAFRPSQSVQVDLATVNRMLSRLATAAPIEEVAEQPPEDAQGPSVAGRGGPDIKWHWAKYAIGMIATDLNEAYAEFSVTEDGWSTPNGKLHSAAEQLNEVMHRLGITGDDIPF